MEAALLGCLLLGAKERITEFLARHPSAGTYFYDLRHQKIYEAIGQLAEADKAVDTITVYELLRQTDKLGDPDILGYLSNLPEKAPSPWNIEYYAEPLRELAIKRRFIAAAAEITEAAYNGKTAMDLGEIVEARMFSVIPENGPNEKSMADLVAGALKDMEQAAEHPGQLRGIATGFVDLDWKTGGLKPGQVFVVAARPSFGKTSLALNIAERVAVDNGLPVGFFSLEMTAEELTFRLITSRARVPSDKAQAGRLTEADVTNLTEAAGRIRKAPLHIADEHGITVGQVRAKARRMAQRHKVKLLVVDYLQLVHPTRRNDSRNVEVAEVSCAVKALAKELAVPIILLSQLNRESERQDRPPRLSDLRDSGSIEQDADIVGLLHRPEPATNVVDLLLEKHRNGPTGIVHLVFLREITRFESAGKGA